MPLYRYEPDSGTCRLCGGGFELRQEIAEPAVSECPRCGQRVHRKAAQTSYLPKHLAPVSVSQAKQAGFTVLKRTCDGSFEKS